MTGLQFMFGLTRRQKQAKDFLTEFGIKNGFTPTLEEMADGLGLKSLSSVTRLLEQLESRGHVVRMRSPVKHKCRPGAIRIIDAPAEPRRAVA